MSLWLIPDDVILVLKIAVYAIGTLFIIGGLALSTIFILISKERYRRIRYETEQQRYISHQDGFGMRYLHDIKTGIIENLSVFPGTHHNGVWQEPPETAMKAWHALVGRRKDDELVRQLPATTQQQIPNLFNILANAERVLVKGPSNAGKTTLFQNIARQTASNITVIDPHFAPGVWPDYCKIVGKSRNHQEITDYLDWLSSELSRRYMMRAEGDESYSTLTVIIDEWMSISEKCDNATKVIVEMITESRKARIRLFIGSHSDTVEALGIRGQGKLREGLLIVRLHYDQFTQERSSTYDYGKGERPCSIYGEPVITQLSNEEQIVSSMLASGQSRSAIAVRLYGHAGGNQLKDVDRIIERMSL